jgi:hypothetical protein
VASSTVRLAAILQRTVLLLLLLQYVILRQTNVRQLQHRVLQIVTVILTSTARKLEVQLQELVLLDAELMELLQQLLVHSVLAKLNL